MNGKQEIAENKCITERKLYNFRKYVKRQMGNRKHHWESHSWSYLDTASNNNESWETVLRHTDFFQVRRKEKVKSETNFVVHESLTYILSLEIANTYAT